MTTTRIAVDWENPAETWWESARDNVAKFPAETRDIITGTTADFVMVPRDVADEFFDVAKSLPDWGIGPEYAPNPILRYDVDVKRWHL